jgi:polar amino acid transport system ATP-binding protein/sulfate transport system ATP-binding protein
MGFIPYTINGLLLDIDNVSLTLGGNLILRDINVKIHDIIRPNSITGQIVGFLGPSGIGKTQLSKTIAGLQKPTSGNVYITPDRKIVEKGSVGYVSQNYLLFEHRTVLSNLLLSCKQNKKSAKECNDKVKYYLDKFDLFDKRNSYPSQLSGGQRQRVAIAQQMLCSDYFLIMDEPFSGLDIITIEKVSEMIISVANEDEFNTIIIITHDVTSAALISDTLWLMGRDKDENGNIVKGAVIKKTINVIEAGLAWQKDIQYTKEFTDFVRNLKTEFRLL